MVAEFASRYKRRCSMRAVVMLGGVKAVMIDLLMTLAVTPVTAGTDVVDNGSRVWMLTLILDDRSASAT